jgi:hypothetical protein
MDTTCKQSPGPIVFSYPSGRRDPTGIRRCGVPIRLDGDPHDGSRQAGILNHQSECTETCVQRLFDLFGVANALVVSRSPEVPGVASDGDLRS